MLYMISVCFMAASRGAMVLTSLQSRSHLQKPFWRLIFEERNNTFETLRVFLPCISFLKVAPPLDSRVLYILLRSNNMHRMK